MKPPQSKQSKEYNLHGGVDPVIANAVSSGKWDGAIYCKLSQALQVFRAHSPQLDYMRISQDGKSFKWWLEKVCKIPWDDTAWNERDETAMSISVYARYDMMLRYQAKCSDDGDRKEINGILCFLRDAVTLMAIHMSRGYKDHDAWRTALRLMQHDLPVQKDLIIAQLESSYHQMFHNVQDSWMSGCKRGRDRPARPRGQPGAAGSASAASGTEGPSMDEGYQPSQPPAVATSAGASSSQQNAHEMLALLQTNMREESAQVWKANERLHDNFVRVETDLRELRACFGNHAAAQEDIRCLRDALRSAVAEISRLKSENSVLRVSLQNNHAEAYHSSMWPSACIPPTTRSGTTGSSYSPCSAPLGSHIRSI